MNTSERIKQTQYKPLTVYQANDGSYGVESGSTDGVRTVTKNGNAFTCDCPARSGTCRHVTSVIVQELKAKGYGIVQVWTSEADAKRQKRQVHRITRNGTKGWVTVGKLDRWAECKRLGDLYNTARHAANCTSWGPKKAAAIEEMRRLWPLINEALKEATRWTGS